MPHFQLANKTGIGSISIHVGNTITLQQWGHSPDGQPLDLESTAPSVVEVSNVKQVAKDTQEFQLTAKSAQEDPVKIRARLPKDLPDGRPKGTDNSAALIVKAGYVTNHSGMTVDLLAELLGRAKDARKNSLYDRILDSSNNRPETIDLTNLIPSNNQSHPFNQEGSDDNGVRKRKGNTLTCGDEMKNFGESAMGGVELNFFPYHKIRKDLIGKGSTDRKLMEYDAAQLARGVTKIRSLLDGKKPVRVVTIHDDVTYAAPLGTIVPQHYITIVGYGDGNKFLYIDPWPGGSNLSYTGGIGANPKKSQFMGILVHGTVGGRLTFVQDSSSYGSFAGSNGQFLEVVHGPA